MKISDEIALSARNLTRRKGRTALTLIGVVIGTCMVVLMISLGIAQTQANDEMLRSWGDLTQIQVFNNGNVVGADGKPLRLDDAAIESFKQMDHVVAATTYETPYNLQANITAGRNGRYVTDQYNLTGVDPAALEPMGFALTWGNWPDTTPANSKAKTLQVLVTDSLGYGFWDSRRSINSPRRTRWEGDVDALGNPVEPFVNVDEDKMTLTIYTGEEGNQKTQSWELEVVGHLQADYSKGWWTQSSLVLRIQDLKMLQAAYNKMAKITGEDTSSYQNVYVKVDELENVAAVEETIHDMGFTGTYSMNQQREQMQKSVMQSQMIFGGVAAVSLLVAAINIINTMTMAIYERTREIGVMKVLGCELGSIRTMFLLESSCIGFLGGVVGVAISAGASFVLNNLTAIFAAFGQTVDLSGLMGGNYYGMASTTGVISIIPPWLMLAALVFATLVGLVSGILPANRAVKISALEAIRHE